MLKTIITSAITYSSTAIDLLIILMLFFAKIKDKKGIRDIYIGQFLRPYNLMCKDEQFLKVNQNWV